MDNERLKRHVMLAFVVVSSMFSIAYMSYITITVFTNPLEIALSYIFVCLVVIAAAFNFVGISYYYDSIYTHDLPPKKKMRGTPSVAIVVASYNEEPAMVERTLKSLQKMDYPKDRLKFYLLDDSTDANAVARLQTSCKRLGATMMHRSERKDFKAGALNAFLEVSDEEYVALFDADERLVDAGFVKDLLPYFAADEKLALVQTIKKTAPGSVFADAVDETYGFFSKFIQPIRSEDKMAMFQGSGGMLRAALVRKAGGFPASLTEDTAMSMQADFAGFHGIFVPKAYVLGRPIEKFSTFVAQQNRYSYGNARLSGDYLANWKRLPSRKRMHYFTQVFGLQYVSAVYVLFAVLTVAFATLGISQVIFSGSAFWKYAPRVAFADLFPMFMTLISFLLISTCFFSSFRKGAIGFFLNFAVAIVRMKAVFNSLRGKSMPFVVANRGLRGKRSIAKAVHATASESSFAAALLLFSAASLLHADVISCMWLAYYSLLFFSAPLFAYLQG
ncbi:MAG: glycosyltransferase [Candidatus Micrarchaeota archaeon]